MRTIAAAALADSQPCPYIPEEAMRLQYFLACDTSPRELDRLLATGWRRFGRFYFRPSCRSCRECRPLRIRPAKLRLSQSQRKIRNRNADVDVRIGPLAFREEIFDVYRDHSLFKFGKEVSRAEFMVSFYDPSCPALQSEYFVDGNLAAVGFLDRSETSLSSVYFVYRKEYSRRGLGIYSVIAECSYAESQGAGYYYLGYCITANNRMNYKDNFKPNQKYEWDCGRWAGDGA